MELFLLLLKIVLVVSAVGLTVLVVLQDNRGGGLAGVLAGYGGESAFGTETMSKVKKLTAYLGALFFVALLALAMVGRAPRGVIGQGLENIPVQGAPAEGAPAQGAPAEGAPAEPAPEPAP